MRIPVDQLLPILGRELYVWRKAILVIFLSILIMSALLAATWPKKFTSATTIFVEEKNVLDPLMQGVAVRAPIIDRVRIARDILFGQQVMGKLAEDLGLMSDNPSDLRREQIINGLKSRTSIANAGRSIIRIEHNDVDAVRAYRAAKRLAELFIAESHEKKYEEAKAAYEFIDRQVQEYHTKLAKSEDEIKQLRSANVEAGGSGGAVGSGADVVSRINQIRTRIEQTKEELGEAEIKKVAMERQLSGESETSLVMTRTGQYRTRISELQAQLSTLRLNYQDSHPDVVRIQHQIDDLYESIKAEEARRQSTPRDSGTDSTVQASDDGIVHNPVYQQLRRDLTQTKIQIETLSARLAELNRQLRQTQNYGKEVHGEEVILTQLTRDTQVNTAIYQDLLRRRENALVSMNMNLERQGMGFSIQDDAEIPLRPSGLLAWHVFVLGTILSVLLPAGLLFAIVSFDGKIRAVTGVAEHFKVPVLGVVPHMWNRPEIENFKLELRWAAILASSTVLVLVLVLILRTTVLQS